MKILGLIFILWLVPAVEEQRLDVIRQAFFNAAAAPEKLPDFMPMVEHIVGGEHSEVMLAYKGAATSMMAELSVAPWTKFSLFTDGTEMIETAIKQNPDCVECRYLRFMIQVKSPRFLDYNANVESDRALIEKHIGKTGQKTLWMWHYESFCRANEPNIESLITTS